MKQWVQRMFRLPIHLHSALVVEAQRRTKVESVPVGVNDLVVEVLSDYYQRGMMGPPIPDGPNGTRKEV